MLPIKIKLAAVRVNANLSQQELADKMGVSRATIGSWESYNTKMSKADVCLFANICNFPEENIFLPY